MDDLEHVKNVRVRLFHPEEGAFTRLNFFLAEYGPVDRGVGLTSIPEAGEVPYVEVMVTGDTAWNMSIRERFLQGKVVEVARLPLAEETVGEDESTGIAFITRMGQLIHARKAFILSYNTLSPLPKALPRSKEDLHALLDTQVDDLALELRVRNALRDTHQTPVNHLRDPLVYLGEVVRLDAQGLKRRHGIGTAVVARVFEYITEHGLWLGMTDEDMQGWQPPDIRRKAGG